MPKPWSQEQMDYLYENYGKLSAKEIADHIGKNTHCIVRMAYKHGLKSSRYFTEEERDYIQSAVGRTSYDNIAKKLGVTYNSIKVYCNRNYCNQYANGNYLTMAEIGRVVGQDRSRIRVVWVRTRKLKHKRCGKNIMVRPDDLFEFMQKHPEIWDATECETWYFDRFEWFNEKRKKDLAKKIEKRWGKEVG